jgi:endonuclease/exonuclease/phosphatase family metal-dependent hydrolase
MGKVCLAFALTGALRVFGFLTEPLLDNHHIHQIVGEPSRIAAPIDGSQTPDANDLNVITWNIERGAAYDSILAVLRSVNADVLLLQEVDRACRRTGYRDVARDLAHALGMNWISGGEFQEIGEGRDGVPAIHGQAILSKYPITHGEVLRFKAQAKWRWSINPVQPRRGGRMALKARTGGMLVYSVHIESGGNEPLQRRQIAEILTDQAHEGADAPVLIGGDFNNGPRLRSSMFGSLSAAEFNDALGDAAKRGPTSSGQLHPIDWIFVRNARPVRGRVVDAKLASDHFPVFAAFQGLASVALAPAK